MNKKINDLSYEQLIFVDIETVKECNNFDENHPYYGVWEWKQRNKETNEIPPRKDVIRVYNDKAALFAEWGKIVCISVGFIHNEELHIKSFTGEEGDILTSYVGMMKKQGRMAVGHNLIAFDNNYIRKRWFVNKLGEYLSDKQGNDVYMKPWLLDESLFDTMVAWKGAGYVNTSLDELAMCFGIASSKGSMKGNEVSDYFYTGRIKEIQQYCERDVTVVANIVRSWKGDTILEPIIQSEVLIEEPSIVEKLYKSNEFSEDIKQEVKQLVGKKKLTLKDKKLLVEILHRCSVNSDMFNKDKPEVIQQKLEDVQEFVNQL